MRKRLEQRKKKLKDMEVIRKKENEKRQEQEVVNTSKALTRNLRGMFKKQGTLLITEDNENSELMRKLRAWKMNKKKYDNEKL